MTRIAVVVTTYNRPDALERALSAYHVQDDLDFELLVADDGSTDATRRLVERFAARVPFPVRHVWHEDLGFRAAAIRNRAIAATAADYVVFTDGDCVPLAGFVRSHRRLAEPGWFVAGNRLLLSRRFTERVLADSPIALERLSAVDWTLCFLRGDVNRLAPLLRAGPGDPLGWRKARPGRWQGAKTCNLGVWRADLVRINGFDETYSGWGLEDSDLVIRLLHAGVRHKSGRFATPLAHLWHAENDRTQLTRNQHQLDELLASDRTGARSGLDGHR